MSIFVILLVLITLGYSLLKSRNILYEIEWKINFKFFLYTILYYSFGLCSISFAWLSIMKSLGSIEKKKKHLLVFLGSMLARRIPLSIWYIGSRFYFYDNSRVTNNNIASASVIEIIMTGFSGLFVFLVLFGLFKNAIIYWILAFLLLLFFVYSFSNMGKLQLKLQNLIKKNFIDSRIINISTKQWWFWLFLYGLGWLLAGISFNYGLRTLIDVNITTLAGLLYSSVTGLIGYISMVIPAGFGLKELALGLLLSNNLPLSLGFLLGIVNRLFSTLTEIFWYISLSIIFKNNP